MSFWDLIRTKSQKTKDEDKDREYFIKILQIGILQLEKSKVPRKAIIKLLAPLRLSEKKEILRKVSVCVHLSPSVMSYFFIISFSFTKKK